MSRTPLGWPEGDAALDVKPSKEKYLTRKVSQPVVGASFRGIKKRKCRLDKSQKEGQLAFSEKVRMASRTS